MHVLAGISLFCFCVGTLRHKLLFVYPHIYQLEHSCRLSVCVSADHAMSYRLFIRINLDWGISQRLSVCVSIEWRDWPACWKGKRVRESPVDQHDELYRG